MECVSSACNRYHLLLTLIVTSIFAELSSCAKKCFTIYPLTYTLEIFYDKKTKS